jgi:hypothetical protein
VDKVWVGVGNDGKVVSGGHNRQRFYTKTRESAIKWASEDDRVVAVVEFSRPETVWKRAVKGAPPERCGLTTGWEAPCPALADSCDTHKNYKCRCGAKPTYLCGATHQFVCGSPLCDYCVCNCSAGMNPRKTR